MFTFIPFELSENDLQMEQKSTTFNSYAQRINLFYLRSDVSYCNGKNMLARSEYSKSVQIFSFVQEMLSKKYYLYSKCPEV